MLSVAKQAGSDAPKGDEALSPGEIARRLNIHLATVYRWLDDGKLKAVKLGPKLWRILPEDFEAFMEARKRGDGKDGDGT